MDVETRLGFGWTPLMCAVSVANYDLAKLLLDRGARANFSKGQSNNGSVNRNEAQTNSYSFLLVSSGGSTDLFMIPHPPPPFRQINQGTIV